MINILEVDPTDRSAVNDLVEVLQAHCTPDECIQFLDDLYRWQQTIPDGARPVMDAYARMLRRGAFVPAIVRRYVTVTATLKDTPEWQEVLAWQSFIASLPAPDMRRVA